MDMFSDYSFFSPGDVNIVIAINVVDIMVFIPSFFFLFLFSVSALVCACVVCGRAS